MQHTRVFVAMTVAIAIASGVAIFEVVLRVRHPEYTRGAILDRIVTERYTVRRPDPEFHHIGDGIFKLRFPAGRDDPRSRIMIVGDSFTMGYGVDPDQRFGALLQRDLGSTYSVDVLAASSYSPSIYCNIVRRATAAARYSAAAVFVDQTDPANDLIYLRDLVQADDPHRFDVEPMAERNAEVNRAWNDIRMSLYGWSGLARYSALVNRLIPVPSLLDTFPANSRHLEYLEMSLGLNSLIHTFNTEPLKALTRSMERVLVAHLDELVDHFREQSVPVILAANPWEYHVSPTPRFRGSHPGPFPVANRLEEILVERYGKEPGVFVLPLTAVFRRQPDPSALFLDRPINEFHWNHAGHAVVERTLLSRLQASGITGPEDAPAP